MGPQSGRVVVTGIETDPGDGSRLRGVDPLGHQGALAVPRGGSDQQDPVLHGSRHLPQQPRTLDPLRSHRRRMKLALDDTLNGVRHLHTGTEPAGRPIGHDTTSRTARHQPLGQHALLTAGGVGGFCHLERTAPASSQITADTIGFGQNPRPDAAFVPPLAGTAVGLGLENSPASSAAAVSADQVGQASGISNMVRYVGESLAVDGRRRGRRRFRVQRHDQCSTGSRSKRRQCTCSRPARRRSTASSP